MRASPVSIRICVPNLVAVRRSCRKGGGVQTDKGTLQLYIVDVKVGMCIKFKGSTYAHLESAHPDNRRTLATFLL